MRNHLIFASLLTACGFDPMPTLALPAPPVAAPQTRVAAREGVWSEQALPLITHEGRRWVVVASGLADDAAEGDIRVVSREPLQVTERAARAATVPARWREGRTLIAHTRAGARCELRVGAAATVLSRVALDSMSMDAWNGRDADGGPAPRPSDASIAAEAYEQASGGRLLVAEVEGDACPEASWAQATRAPEVRFLATPADAATRRAALAAYRATDSWRGAQASFREYADDGITRAPDALWDESHAAPEVTVWRAEGGARSFVTVRGVVPFEGCGAFAAAVWSVFELEGERLALRGVKTDDQEFVASEVVDADGDGAPEFISSEEVRAMGPSGYEPVLSVSYPVHGCPC